MSTSEARSWC